MTEPEPKKEFPPEMVILSPERMLCPRHREVFAEQWPSGVPSWMAFSFARLSEDGGLLCIKETDKVERARAIEALLDIEPICCRLGGDKTFLLYRKIDRLHKGLWKRRKCQGCGRHNQLGCVYKCADANGNPIKFKHLCLWCVTHCMKKVDKNAN